MFKMAYGGSNMKKIKFQRPKGFAGHIPRDWIDATLPICPFCGKRPDWEVGVEMGILSFSKYHFRCQKCGVILSIPMPDVAPPTNLLMLAARNKEKIMTVENGGSTELGKRYVGKKLKIEKLKSLSHKNLKDGEMFCPKCGAIIAPNEKFCPKCGTKVR